MSYFIFTKDLDNVDGTLYRIAENLSDFNNLNISKENYKIIEDSENNFNLVKYKTKYASKYNQNDINYIDTQIKFLNWDELNNYISNVKKEIKCFLDNNPNNSLKSKWDSYYIQLNTLTESQFTFPLNKSLEQYFKDQEQPSLNPLQLP